MIEYSHKSESMYSKRAWTVTAIIVGIALIIVIRLAGIQLLDSKDLKKLSESQGLRSEDLLPERGLILDRHNNILANNVIEYKIGARYVDLLKPESCFATLAKIFGESPAYYRDKFKKQSSYYTLETNVSPEIVQALRTNKDCHGLNYDKIMSRFYPYQDAAGQLIGFVNAEGEGQSGIEQYYDKNLKGQQGTQMIQRDKRGNIITLQNHNTHPAIPGGNIQTTIDVEYQIILEEELEKAVKENNALSGMAVLMDPRTGEVLAMTNYPFFNPNDLRNSTATIRKNRVIADQFEPGSIFKFLPISAALENSIFSPTSKIFCENGKWKVKDRYVHDTKEHEWLTVKDIMVVSSNIGAGKIAQKVGSKTIYDYARNFGFGEPTAIGLWGESDGTLKSPEKWSSVWYSQVGMGHGVSVSMMQMMCAYSAIANGGILMKPYVVSNVYNEKEKITNSFNASPVRRIISKETSEILRNIMEAVVDSGTAQQAQIKGYHVAGKTGTAQKVIDGKYSNSKYIASFIGFFPANNPVLVCGIVLDEPEFYKHHGGTAAAPAVKNTFSRIINTPKFNQYYPSVSKELNAITQSHTTSRSNTTLSILHSQVSDNKEKTYIGEPKEKDKTNNLEDIEEYDIIMPDLVGMHVLNAEKILTDFGLSVIKGSNRGKVISQIPSPGSFLMLGDTCKLEVNK
jgi:cell division protein FtsI (penicillin-binding protein 3)